MSHYQKLATLAFRLFAVLVIAVGVAGVIYCLFPAGEPIPERNARFISSLCFIAFGCLGFALSPALGRLVGKDL